MQEISLRQMFELFGGVLFVVVVDFFLFNFSL